MLFEGFETLDIKVPDQGFKEAQIHIRHGGKGPPLLLLHGNPMTHAQWNKIAHPLAEKFHVIMTDLRGYGDSIGPEDGGEKSINYSFRAMALDQVAVMEKLGYKEFFVTGHDRGARTTARMCLDHPEKVQRAAIIDILPNYHVWTHASMAWGMKSWHWLFMAQPYPFPEKMMEAVPAEWFMTKKLSKPGIGTAFFNQEAFAEYVRCFTPKTIHASCEDYRACATSDFEMDKADFEAGRKISQPLLITWGGKSHTGTVHGDLLPIWKNYADNVTGGPIACGHYVPEEAPEETLKLMLQHFDR